MGEEKPSSIPPQLRPDPGRGPTTNQLAKVSFFSAIGVTFAWGSLTVEAVNSSADLILFCVVLISAFGAFCGHCACVQIKRRKYNQEGIAMAVSGIIFCYIYLGWSGWILWLMNLDGF
ncbi:MAG: hypothetical protein CMP26_08355 [Roseibacillus sp.]|jgi:hypothetical protein|nr:hypothetical protein [Verrucomicrobiales bacterium]MAF22594.1 hypothetical protein [Roseibacillus sp.]HAO96196.1 hypothetical protein [Verrucomicrobiales bacterium]|tara:strand:+ start:387 stop:740 length:354 start_codon:yes stop_codon:yes gene_type:complete